LSGVSSKTLVRRYEEAYGIDPTEEIRRLRLDQAKRMLRETDQPIAEIAALCGFSSQAGFYNYFMRHTRTCPSEFRKAGKEAVQEAGPNHLLGD
jgi:AraC family transcriptional regulator